MKVFNKERLFLILFFILISGFGFWLVLTSDVFITGTLDELPAIVLGIVFFVSFELLFWSNYFSAESVSEKVWSATITGKAVCFGVTFLLMFAFSGLSFVIVNVVYFIMSFVDIILKWAATILGVGFVLFIYFWLNSFRIDKNKLHTKIKGPKEKKDSLLTKLVDWFSEEVED